MGKRKFTDEQEQLICTRYAKGESTVQLSACLGVTCKTIWNILQRNGTPVRDMITAKRGIGPSAASEVCSRYIGGESTVELATAFGVAHGTVIAALKRNGVERRTISAAKGGLQPEAEIEVCRRYALGESAVDLGAAFGVSGSHVASVLKHHGVERRTMSEAMGGLHPEAIAEVCHRYAKGESSRQLADAFGVTYSTICNVLKRNGIERRAANGYNDSVQHALDCTGNHTRTRECEFYLFELARYSDTHCKPGIAFDADQRAAAGGGEYGAEVLRLLFATRREAYFLEQAVLDATRANADCPDDLWEWIGATEVRAMPANEMATTVLRLAEELEALGPWEFAARYVPMTSAQRLACQQRAMAG